MEYLSISVSWVLEDVLKSLTASGWIFFGPVESSLVVKRPFHVFGIPALVFLVVVVIRVSMFRKE